MIRSAFSRTASAMALVGLFALSGCSDETPSATEGGAPEEGPLTKIFNEVAGTWDPDVHDRQQVEIEDLVAACMAAEGFEYIPHAVSTRMMASSSDEDLVDHNTEEWVAENGYGMTMEPTEEPVDEDGSPVRVDPNADYVASLSEGEAAAYRTALTGLQDSTQVVASEDSGCQGAAHIEVIGDMQSVYSDPNSVELYAAMDELYVAADAHPRTVEATVRWADCMADAGYPDFTTPHDAMIAVSDAFAALHTWTGGVDEEDTGPSSAATAEYRKLEIAIAVADFGCKQKADWDKIALEVRIELEETFVKDNKAAIDEYVAALQTTRK